MMRGGRTILLICLACAWPWALHGSEPDATAFVVTKTDGTAQEGTLASIDPKWSIELGAQKNRLGAEEWVTLRRAHSSLPAFPDGQQVLFANGDRLAAQILQLSGERLRIRLSLGEQQEIRLPLAPVSVVWLTHPETAEEPERLLRRLAASRRTRDTLLLRNGETLSGILTALDSQGSICLESDKKEITVDFSKVAAIGLNTELARLRPPQGPYAHAVFKDGSRLGLAAAQMDGKVIRSKTLFGAVISSPIEELVALDLRQGRAIYLSDLKPTKYAFTSYLGGSYWPYALDASVAGRDLHLAGSVYDKGLGMHSASRLSFSLDGKYRRFEALVGLDELTGAKGSARIQVEVDGKRQDLTGDRELTAKTGPLPVCVNVTGARELILVVAFGRHADVQDHVNWVDARVIK
jgi:hypothetical protein